MKKRSETNSTTRRHLGTLLVLLAFSWPILGYGQSPVRQEQNPYYDRQAEDIRSDSDGHPFEKSVQIADYTEDTDARARLQDCLDSLATAGGVCRLPSSAQIRILGNIVVAKGRFIDCGRPSPGNPGGTNSSTPFQMLGQIKLASTATITFSGGGSGLRNCLIVRDGMVFPAPDASAFAGTALTITADDVSIENVMVLGFNQCLYDNGGSRLYVHHFDGDCLGGGTGHAAIKMQNSFDTSRITDVHLWPFATIASFASIYNPHGKQSCDLIVRHGTGISLGSPNAATTNTILDRITVENFDVNFDFSYSADAKGGKLWSDYIPNCTGGTPSNTIGFKVDGQATNVSIDDLSIYSSYTGLFTNTSSITSNVHITFLHLSQIARDCIEIRGAIYLHISAIDTSSFGGLQACNAHFATITTSKAVVAIDGGQISNIGLSPSINLTTVNDLNGLRIARSVWSDLRDGASLVTSTQYNIGQLTAASSISLPSNIDDFAVLGEPTIIKTITPCDRAGRKITLTFLTSQTLSGGGNLSLSGAATFDATAAPGVAPAISFLCSGGQIANKWVELSRTQSVGNWAPVVAGSLAAGIPTYSARAGSYEVSGNTVTARFNVVLSAFSGAAGSFLIDGLPYASAAAANEMGTCYFSQLKTGMDANYTMITAAVLPGDTKIAIQESGPSLQKKLDVSNFVEGQQFAGTCIYRR